MEPAPSSRYFFFFLLSLSLSFSLFQLLHFAKAWYQMSNVLFVDLRFFTGIFLKYYLSPSTVKQVIVILQPRDKEYHDVFFFD